MTRILPFLIVPLFLLVLVSSVNAQTTTGTDSASRLKQQMQELKSQKKAAVSNIKEEAKENRMELKEKIKDSIAAKREETKEIVKAKRDEFKLKLQTLKDEKKRALVDRIDTKLANANIKHTDRFTQVLSNLQIILDKMADEVDKTAAQAAIDTAKKALENQAAKTYTITISTETALRSDVGAVTSGLRLDLSATHKLVIDAKQAVQALREKSGMMKKEAAGSANL